MTPSVLTKARRLGLPALAAVLVLLALAGCTSTATPEFSLTGVEWQWQSWREMGSEPTDVPDPENYTLNFNTDGTLNGRADCNQFAGTYTQEQGGIQIFLGPSTLAACPEGSLDTTYLAALSQVVAGGNDGTGNLALESGGGQTRMIFSAPAAQTTGGGFLGLPWWLWLLGLLALGLLLWWLFGRNRPAPAPAPQPAQRVAPPAPKAEAPATAGADEVAADDLTRIEGIGPKISAILTAAGIRTFAQLSQTSQAELQRILAASDLKGSYGDPTTWPAQAELAASGQWEALASMQAGLKGGRLN